MSPFPKNSKNPFMWNRFSKNIINTRRGSYHEGRHQGYNTYIGRYNAPYNIGVELECASPQRVELLPTNFFSYESDCSISSFGFGVEFVSHPIPHTLARREEMWSGVCNWLDSKGFKSWEFGESGCGLHIHIGREALGANREEQNEALGRLVILYQNMSESVKMSVFGRGVGRWCGRDSYTSLDDICDKIARGEKVSKNEVKEIGEVKSEQMDRYKEINVTNRATIEFRRGRGSVNARRIAKVVAFCDLLCEYSAKVANPSKLTQKDFFTYIKGLKKMKNHPLMEIISNL